MKILVTGATGLLGRALVARLAPYGDVVGLSRHPPTPAPAYRHLTCDLTDADATRAAVRRVDPDVVIHAQAMTDVDRCEQEPSVARRMNLHTVEHLCDALRLRSVLLLIISSDQVFDGTLGRPYTEDDAPNPINVYGASKRAAEEAALRYPTGCVVRTGPLFGPGRTTFCDTLVERAARGERTEVFLDQTISPTYTEDFAEGIGWLLKALTADPAGAWPRIYHVVNAGACRRVEFARRLLELLGYSERLLVPIRMAEQQHPAHRPAFAGLASRYVQTITGRTLRAWDDALQAYLQHHWLN